VSHVVLYAFLAALTEKITALKTALSAETGQGSLGDSVGTSVQEEFRHFSREQDTRIRSLQDQATTALQEVYVCVCVCVREREREYVCVRVCAYLHLVAAGSLHCSTRGGWLCVCVCVFVCVYVCVFSFSVL
jgi:hypothetical protein